MYVVKCLSVLLALGVAGVAVLAVVAPPHLPDWAHGPTGIVAGVVAVVAWQLIIERWDRERF